MYLHLFIVATGSPYKRRLVLVILDDSARYRVVVVVVTSQFYVPPASERGHYGVDIPASHGGGRPQVPLRAIFRLERAPG